MKALIAALVALTAVSAFAQDKGQPVYGKTTPNPVVAPAEAKKEVKPSKSTPVKDEKAAAPAAKPAASK